MANMISSITGSQWKRIRALLSTYLTATKMNRLAVVLPFVAYLGEQSISTFDEVGHALCRNNEPYADTNIEVALEK